MNRRNVLSAALIGLAALAHAQTPPNEQPPIQDNSFLVEEAYNQEAGVVQHISTFTRMWNSKDWVYNFTQEWSAPHAWRHQFSYSLVGMHSGDSPNSGAGLGDVVLNYRYQVLGDGESRVTFAPRISVMLPTGDVAQGRGAGGVGWQTNLPLSVVVNRRIVTHWNAGGTYIPHARAADGSRAGSVGYGLGQSVVFLANPRFNFLIESVVNRFQAVTGPGQTEWTRSAYVSPGVRWAYNYRSGLQIVPGIAIPIGVGPSAGDRGLVLYLSFEHPFTRGE